MRLCVLVRSSGKVIALMDVPGYLVSSMFFQVYPKVVNAYGWGAVWRLVGGMVAVSTVCITMQQRLEARGAGSKKPCIAHD